MKRRIIMGIAAIVAIFATENVVDILITRYTFIEAELVVWIMIALGAGVILHEVGEDRGDW